MCIRDSEPSDGVPELGEQLERRRIRGGVVDEVDPLDTCLAQRRQQAGEWGSAIAHHDHGCGRVTGPFRASGCARTCHLPFGGGEVGVRRAAPRECSEAMRDDTEELTELHLGTLTQPLQLDGGGREFELRPSEFVGDGDVGRAARRLDRSPMATVDEVVDGVIGTGGSGVLRGHVGTCPIGPTPGPSIVQLGSSVTNPSVSRDVPASTSNRRAFWM